MLKFLSQAGSIAILSIIPVLAYAERPEVYTLPDEAKCTVRKQDKITYCTDTEGNPITGELHRYMDNILRRMYPLENGILEGTARTYHSNGNIESEKTYNKGILEGEVKKYYRNGSLESVIPYSKGKKEGIAKNYAEDGSMTSQMIYTNNELNGEMRIYTPNGTTLYSLENEDNKLVSGSYYYQTKDGNMDMTAIPPLVIEALNIGCLELQTEMSTSACAAVFNASSSVCDERWRRDNRKEIRKYLADCAKGAVD
ncbi:MAG: toxin-antitoxin system YwqK family antitoxin [Acetobacter sp.]|nr:toxin-antitoxin system YwqK family antitoxin [Acetobacter sp.]